jgi:hypothetical protein
MPIRPELRHFYQGPHWQQQRRAAIARAGGKCEICGIPHRMLNGAHPSHDPRSGRIAAWCPSCHARHDAPHRIAVTRRRQAKRAGQSWLFPEVEYAADPPWMTPTAVLRLAQQELF